MVMGISWFSLPVQADPIRGYFSDNASYQGSVKGQGNKNYGDSIRINLFHKCYADPAKCDLPGYPDSSFDFLRPTWDVGNTDATDPRFDIENFENTGGKPDLYLYAEWDQYFLESDGGVVEIYGVMSKFKSILNQNTLFYGVELNCEGDGFIDLKAANPEGVGIEFRNSQFNMGNEKDFYLQLNNPALIEEIGGGGDAPGGGPCFEEDGSGVKVPYAKACHTDDEAKTGDYTSLRVGEDGVLDLGGNLIIEPKLTEINLEGGAQLRGENAGLVKTGDQTTLLSGEGQFSYQGPTVIQGGVLKLGVAGAIPEDSEATIEEEAHLIL